MKQDDWLQTRSSLLHRLQQDDSAGWHEFFNLYGKLLYLTAAQAGCSDVNAQDVVQETLIHVSKHISEFQHGGEGSSFKAWLLQALRWKISDHFRRDQRDEARRLHSFEPESGGPSAVERLADASAELGAIWEEQWQQTIQEAALERVKRKATPKDVQIFYLRVLRGQSMREVKESLGVNAAHVYVATHRVSKLIKKEIEKLERNGV